MKSPAFEYRRFSDLPGLLSAKARCGAEAYILAGGQSLVPLMNLRKVRPALLLDINAIAALRGISASDGTLTIGAATTFSEVLAFPQLSSVAPLLAQAIPYIGYPAVRNRGTVGGNLAFADPGAELSACALALDATLIIRSQSRERTIAAAAFFKGSHRTALLEDEVLTGIAIPPSEDHAHFAFSEIGRRSRDAAVAGVAIAAKETHGKLTNIRVAFMGLSDRPVLAQQTAHLIETQDLTAPEDIAGSLRAEIDIAGDHRCDAATRLRFASVLAARALRDLRNNITGYA